MFYDVILQTQAKEIVVTKLSRNYVYKKWATEHVSGMSERNMSKKSTFHFQRKSNFLQSE